MDSIEARCRNSDPDTSHMAKDALNEGAVQSIASAVYNAIDNAGADGLTCSEIIDITGIKS